MSDAMWERQFINMTGRSPKELDISCLFDANEFLKECGLYRYAPCPYHRLSEYQRIQLERAARQKGGHPHSRMTNKELDAIIRYEESPEQNAALKKELARAFMEEERRKENNKRVLEQAERARLARIETAAFKWAFNAGPIGTPREQLRQWSSYRSLIVQKPAYRSRPLPALQHGWNYSGTPGAGIPEQHLVIDLDVYAIEVTYEEDREVSVADRELRRMGLQKNRIDNLKWGERHA